MRQVLQTKYDSSGTTNEQKNHNDDNDGDGKPAARVTSAETTLAGSIATDAATVREEEYDLLFGLHSEAIPPCVAAANADDEPDD